MRFGNIRTDMILSTAQEELDALRTGQIDASNFPRTCAAISSEFPTLTEPEILKNVQMILSALTWKSEEKVELIVTAPKSFALKTKTTLGAVEELLKSAEKTIILTGYSISEYVSNFMDVLIQKSRSGVLVKLYINKVDNQTSLEKILRYQSKYLQLYNYSNDDDKMSALHAKIISVDCERTAISSANLSYHGMSGNIELGCLIESQKIGKQIEHIFQQLYKERVFKRLYPEN